MARDGGGRVNGGKAAYEERQGKAEEAVKRQLFKRAQRHESEDIA